MGYHPTMKTGHQLMCELVGDTGGCYRVANPADRHKGCQICFGSNLQKDENRKDRVTHYPCLHYPCNEGGSCPGHKIRWKNLHNNDNIQAASKKTQSIDIREKNMVEEDLKTHKKNHDSMQKGSR